MHLTLLVSGKNPDLDVGQREDSDGLWDAFLQLVFYSRGTQELTTQTTERATLRYNSSYHAGREFSESFKAISVL